MSSLIQKTELQRVLAEFQPFRHGVRQLITDCVEWTEDEDSQRIARQDADGFDKLLKDLEALCN